MEELLIKLVRIMVVVRVAVPAAQVLTGHQVLAELEVQVRRVLLQELL